MDSQSNMQYVGRGKRRTVQVPHRVWTFNEEKELVHALKELISGGNKCNDEFKSGYLNLLENMLATKFPGTGLKGEPHINSKIHVWKKQYTCLRTMIGVLGIGSNSLTYHIDALPEVDPTARSLKNKTFPFYLDWIEIFGNDRAMGKDSQLYTDVVQE
ncbi:hypothetical protein ACS0TY_024449 [Phlomoides rotata]